jgi:hypothetical protein
VLSSRREREGRASLSKPFFFFLKGIIPVSLKKDLHYIAKISKKIIVEATTLQVIYAYIKIKIQNLSMTPISANPYSSKNTKNKKLGKSNSHKKIAKKAQTYS